MPALNQGWGTDIVETGQVQVVVPQRESVVDGCDATQESKLHFFSSDLCQTFNTHCHSLTNKPHQSYRPPDPCRPRDLDLLTSAERMCTKFGVDSSSRFPFRARTDRHKITDATDNPTYPRPVTVNNTLC